MMDYALLEAMAAVLRTGSFEKAARHIGVTPSAISQRIRLLEERVGAGVIVRGQPCTATAAGQRLYRHVEEVGLMEHNLRIDMGALLPAGATPTVRIAVNADSLATWFLPALAGIHGRLFDLVIEDESNTDELLRRGEVSAAISTSGKPVQGCGCMALGAQLYIATASPAFMHRWFSEGVNPDTLAVAPCITFNMRDELQQRWLEHCFGTAIAPPTHWIASSNGFVDATLNGLGWGMNPYALVNEHLAGRRLQALLPEKPIRVPLFWHWSRAVESALADMTAAIRTTARKNLYQ